MIIVILLLILFIYFFFIRDLKESFFLMSPRYFPMTGFYRLGIPTRSTRLMSYDIRGDPFAYNIYPSYYSWGSPYNAYIYSPTKYDITGRYIIPIPKNMGKKEAKVIKKLEAKIKPKQ